MTSRISERQQRVTATAALTTSERLEVASHGYHTLYSDRYGSGVPMRMKGASKDYKFGQKNNWRRTIWNEILRRTNGREQTELIVYLAGPDDHDRRIATQKGVPDQNLIAIDRAKPNVDAIRESRHPVVHGELVDILGSWPRHRPVCAVLMDFCSGFEQPTVDAYDLLERRPFRDAVVMVNMQRGRDVYSNSIRKALCGQDVEDFPWLWAVSHWSDPCGPAGADCLTETHRALQWLVYHSVDAVQTGMPGIIEHIRAAHGYEEGFEDGMALMFAGQYFARAKPHFYSYKSGVLTFDSVVCENPYGRLFAAAESDGELDSREYDDHIEAHHVSTRNPELARKIAAMLAIRTFRLQHG